MMEDAQLLALDTSGTAVLTAVLCGIVALVLVWGFLDTIRASRRTDKAKFRRDASIKLAEKISRQFQDKHPGTNVDEILALPLSELITRLKGGLLSPDAVLYTYIKKAVDVSQRLNCTTEFLLEGCEQLTDMGKCRDGVLFGVPVSIKDNLSYKGHDTCCGLTCLLEKPACADSVLVQVLKRQGAIPFVKTNVPQGLLNYDCSNPIFGQTLNPYNTQKTSGGSSGGEAALIGGGGSILGIGTDIGGSIRIPASFCGICGFKPTAGRVSLNGCTSCCRGQTSLLASVGCMGKDVDALAMCMKALSSEDMFHLDPTVPPVQFKEQVYLSSKPLRIGYYDNDGYLLPSPSMSRALQETRGMLEKAGHTLVPFSPPRITCAVDLAARSILADGGTSFLRFFKEGPTDPSLRPQTVMYRLPRIIKKTICFFLRPLYPRMATAINSACGVNSISDLWKHNALVEDYRREFIAQWRELGLDVLLCPVLGPAYNFGYCGKLTSALSYTILYNLLNFPAGVVPVSTVTEEDENRLKHYKGNFGDPWEMLFKKAVTGGQGLPVAVQCVALTWQDELCLSFMREVERLVKEQGNK